MIRTFATISLDTDSNSKWVEILHVGTFDQMDGSGPFDVTLANLENAVTAAKDKFFQHGATMPIFLGHQIITDPVARLTEERQGGFSEMKVEDGKLLGFATYTDDMAKKIRDKKYEGISAEFDTNVRVASGDSIGFGLTAAGITNTPFLEQAPISLSVPAAQEGTMAHSVTEQGLMVLTGASTPETAFASVKTMTAENVTLKADNVKLLADNVSMKDGLDNQRALAVITKAIGENKPVAGMVKGFDAQASADVAHPALAAINLIGGIAGAERVFAALTPLAKVPAGVNSKEGSDPAAEASGEGTEEIDGIPQTPLTLAQARKHYCEKNDIPLDEYKNQQKFFASVPENVTLIRDGYILVEQDQPKDKE